MRASPISYLVKLGERVTNYKKQTTYGWLNSGMGYTRDYGLRVINASITGDKVKRDPNLYGTNNLVIVPIFRRAFASKNKDFTQNRFTKTNNLNLI